MKTTRIASHAFSSQCLWAIAMMAAVAVFSPSRAYAEPPLYFFHQIAQISGPGGLSAPAINAHGEVVYRRMDDVGQIDSLQTIYTGTASTITPVIDNTGVFYALDSMATINDLGDVAFRGVYSLDSAAVVRYTAATQGMTIIAESDGANPLATFSHVSGGAINNSGTVAFSGELTDTGQGFVAVGTGGPLSYVDVLGPGWRFNDTHRGPAINIDGPSLELAWTTAADGLLGEATLIEKGNTFDHTTIAQGAELSPTVTRVDGISLSDAGDVSYRAELAGGSEAIYYGNGGAPTLVADTTGEFAWFYPMTSISDAGVLFHARLDVAGGGIYTGPNVLDDKVLADGETVGYFPSTAEAIFTGRNAMNNSGQIAMTVRFADGTTRVMRADPMILVKVTETLQTVASMRAAQSSGMGQIVPISSGSEMLSFAYFFPTTTGQLVVRLGGEILTTINAPADPMAGYDTFLTLVDIDSLFRDRPDELLLEFTLLGAGGTAGMLLDNIDFASVRNGGFDTGDLTGWQTTLMVEGDGAGVAVDPFSTVPEPTTLALLAFITPALLRRRRHYPISDSK